MSKRDFVDFVANDCIKDLPKETIDELVKYPITWRHHMFLGLFIRNKYIHGNKEASNFGDADELSSIILERIFSLLLPDEYEYGDTLTFSLFENKKFINLRNVYKSTYGDYPVNFIKEAKNNIKKTDDKKYEFSYYSYKDIDAYVDKLAEDLWNESHFEEECENRNIATNEIAAYVKNIKEIYHKDGVFIPLNISWLTVKNKITCDEYNELSSKLIAIMDDNFWIIKKLNSKFFENRLIAKAALRCSWAMEYMPIWKNDDELVYYAIEHGPAAIEFIDKHYLEDRDFVIYAILHSKDNAIMRYEEMAKYRSDRELVKLACEISDSNLYYVDESFQDDYEIAEIAIKNAGHFSVYDALGPKLKNDKSLALLECENDRPYVEGFIDKFKDDSEIAKKIIALHGKNCWSLDWMSDRIKKKFGIE